MDANAFWADGVVSLEHFIDALGLDRWDMFFLRCDLVNRSARSAQAPFFFLVTKLKLTPSMFDLIDLREVGGL